MSAPTKDGAVWRHRVMVKGKRTSGTFTTKAAALAWEAEQRTAIAGGAATTQTCSDAFDRYERDVSRKKRGHRWEKLRLKAIGKSALGKVLMRDVNASHVAEWRDNRLKSVQGSTVNREMNLLSNVFTLARKEWKWIMTSPTKEVARPKENNARFRRVTDDEIKIMCDALGWANAVPTTKKQSVAAVFLFALETAMRAGEICKLARGDIVGRVATLHVTKSGKPREVPLSARALELWNMCPDGFGITTASLDALFRKTRDNETAIEDMTFHDTRHEAITRLAKKLHVLDLARMVGHKNLKMLMTYYNMSTEDIAAKL